MPRYTDELDALRDCESELRARIAVRLAEEAGEAVTGSPSAARMSDADDAIAAWREQGEEEADLAAFRTLGPLQQLLAEHRRLVERIHEVLDRRLG